MKTWIQLATQQSKTFELAVPLIIGETYTISMNSYEPFMISVGDVFVGETVDGSLEFIATNSDDVMITSYSDISMEFEIKLELGSKTEWSPAPEDAYDLDLPNGAYHIQGGDSFSNTAEGGIQASVATYAWSNISLNGVPLPLNETQRYREDSSKLEFTGTNLDFIAVDPVISTDSLIEYSAQSTEVSNVFNPISQVQVYWDDVSAFEVGDDTGSTIVINTPWATQSSTDYIHSILNGYQYIPAQGTRVYADPAIQLGDTFTYGTINQLVASVVWSFDGSVTGNFDAPQNNDYNFDDPQSILMQNEFKKKISLGDSYQGVSIGRQDGIQMLLSPDGSEENAIGRYYADLNRGMAFQTRDTIMSPWQNWLYFDMQEKIFKLSLYSTTEEVDEKFDGLSGAVQENTSSIAINAQGIQQEITERTTQGELILAQTSSLVQQTAEDLSVIFSKLEADQDLTNGEIELIQSYFRINENGVIIGKSNSAIEFFAENNRVGFRENGNDIAYWEEGTMHVDRLIAVTTIMVGYHLIEKYDSPVAGNTTIVRIGD